MLFTSTKENFSHALNLINSVAGRGGNLPILSNILIHAKESNVELIATDLEIALRMNVRAKVDKTGSFTVPAKTLNDVVQLISDNSIEIELKENELEVRAGSSSTKIKGQSDEEFPVIPEIEENHHYLLDAQLFKDSLSKVLIAAARNEIRPELAGTYFGLLTGGNKELVLAATDSYRLAEKKIPVKQGEDEVSCIVPIKTVSEMIKVIGLSKGEQSESDVRLWVSDNQIAIRYNGFEMTSRLVDGKYPDYTQIIPSSFKTTATLPVDTTIKHIKAASLFTTNGINAVSFDVNASENNIAVSSTSAQTGEHSSVVDADVSGEENSILLNHRYVLDGLQHINGTDVEFLLNSSEMPCMFRGKGDESYLYIVMPIRQ